MTIEELQIQARAAMASGRPDDALEHIRRAIALAADNPQLVSQEGICLMMLGRITEGITAFENAHRLAGRDGRIAGNLAKAYLQAGRPDDAMALLRPYISGDNKQGPLADILTTASLTQARNLHRQGHKVGALDLLVEAEQWLPQARDIAHLRGVLASDYVPPWHIPMLAHNARNMAYEEAICAAVRPGDIVLDIGTGTGLLAMMAVRAGAGHVYACEVNPVLAALAVEIVERNNMADKITIIEKHSTALNIGEDIPDLADLLVTEIFDNGLVGEGCLPSIDDAWKRLLQPDARVVPEGAVLHGTLVAAPEFFAYHHVDTVCGFDISPINRLTHGYGYKDVPFAFDACPRNQRLTAPFTIHEWDFSGRIKGEFSHKLSVPVQYDGQADAMLFWFDLKLFDGVRFSTENPSDYDHWRQVVQILEKPIPCKKSYIIQLNAGYDKYFHFG